MAGNKTRWTRMRLPPNGRRRWIPRIPRRLRKRLPPTNSPRAWRCNGRPWSRTAAAISATRTRGERVLSQEEIDNLLGFTVGDVNLDDNSGIRAIIDFAMVSYERLPMLEIVFDRLVRLMTTSLAQFHLRQRRSLARPHHLGPLRRLHEFDPAAGRALACSRPRSGRISASRRSIPA